MTIHVLTPDKEVFTGRITSVKVPGTQGEFQVLRNHAPIVSSLEPGEVEIVTSSGVHRILDTETGVIKTREEPGKKVTFTIESGFIEVLNNEVSLLVSGISMAPLRELRE